MSVLWRTSKEVMTRLSLACVGAWHHTAGQASETVSYSYDAQARLTQATSSGTGDNAGLAISYQYDLTNNRLSYGVAGSKGRGQQVVVVPVNGYTLIPINP